MSTKRAIMILIPVRDGETPLESLEDVRKHIVEEWSVRQASVVGVIDGDHADYVEVVKNRSGETGLWYLNNLLFDQLAPED